MPSAITELASSYLEFSNIKRVRSMDVFFIFLHLYCSFGESDFSELKSERRLIYYPASFVLAYPDEIDRGYRCSERPRPHSSSRYIPSSGSIPIHSRWPKWQSHAEVSVSCINERQRRRQS